MFYFHFLPSETDIFDWLLLHEWAGSIIVTTNSIAAQLLTAESKQTGLICLKSEDSVASVIYFFLFTVVGRLHVCFLDNAANASCWNCGAVTNGRTRPVLRPPGPADLPEPGSPPPSSGQPAGAAAQRRPVRRGAAGGGASHPGPPAAAGRLLRVLQVNLVIGGLPAESTSVIQSITIAIISSSSIVISVTNVGWLLVPQRPSSSMRKRFPRYFGMCGQLFPLKWRIKMTSCHARIPL